MVAAACQCAGPWNLVVTVLTNHRKVWTRLCDYIKHGWQDAYRNIVAVRQLHEAIPHLAKRTCALQHVRKFMAEGECNAVHHNQLDLRTEKFACAHTAPPQSTLRRAFGTMPWYVQLRAQL